MKLRPVRNYGSDGGPWCNVCSCWTEVDADREAANVCVRCGRPSVVMKPPAWANRQRAMHKGIAMTGNEVHAEFEKMRAMVDAAPDPSPLGCSDAARPVKSVSET